MYCTMYYNHAVFTCYVAMLFSAKVYAIECSNGNTSITEDAAECCTNYFRVNDSCQECLPGFFGENCTGKCPYPRYGWHCDFSCACPMSECDHRQGCPSTTWSAYQKSTTKTIPMNRTSPKSASKVYETGIQENNDTTFKSIIVALGSLLCVVLILMIIKEIYRYRQTCCYNTINDALRINVERDNVYAEVNDVTIEINVLEDNKKSGSTDLIRDGYTSRTEMPYEDCDRNTKSTLCKEKYQSKDHPGDGIRFETDVEGDIRNEPTESRYVVKENIIGHEQVHITQNAMKNAKEENKPEISKCSTLPRNIGLDTINCASFESSSEGFEFIFTYNVYINEKTESTYL